MGSISKTMELFSLSMRFSMRRFLKKAKTSDIKALVVDLDGTLLKNGLPVEALKLAYGSKIGSELNESLETRYANGELSLDEALIEGHKTLIRKGFTRNDWKKLVEKSVKSHARRDLIEALRSLRNKGIKILVSTKGSYYAADLVSRKLKFDGAVGSEEIFDAKGRMSGLKTLLCGRNGMVNGVKVICGSDFISRKLDIKPQNIAFVYDEFTDIVVMEKGGMFILADFKEVPWRKLTDISVKFRTYDVLIKNGADLKFIK